MADLISKKLKIDNAKVACKGKEVRFTERERETQRQSSCLY